MNKLNPQQINEIKKKYKTGKFTHRALAEEYGVSRQTINRVTNPDYAAKEREINRERTKTNQSNYKTKTYPPLTCHLEKDADIIEKLDSVKNRQGYIKGLVRKDIKMEKSDKNL